MPNDTLDEIEARWKDGEDDPAYEDIRSLIEMVRARDRVVEALEDAVNWWEIVKMMAERPVSFAKDYTPSWFKAALAALDTPPAQESTE